MTMHITVIAKAPIAGTVKTRLCPPCTHQQAAEIAAASLMDTLTAVEFVIKSVDPNGIRPVLLIDGAPPTFVPASFEVVDQRGGGLEERLRNGFADLGPGLMVGMDTPAAVRHLDAAIDALRRGYDVIGLAIDGGYWCIGLAEADADTLSAVFDRIPMSCSHTGTAQLSRMHYLGRPVRLLPMARDLDSIDDLYALDRTERNGPAEQLGELGRVAARVIASFG